MVLGFRSSTGEIDVATETLLQFSSESIERNEADDRPENDPRFLARAEGARKSLRDGHGVKLENIKDCSTCWGF